MADTVKITKAMVLNSLKGAYADVAGDTVIGDVTVADVIDYIDTTLEQLEKKAAKAKETAAKKKAEGDELKAAVLEALTDEFETREAIFNKIEGEEGDNITVAKVGARLTQLVASGEAVKDEIKPEGSKSKKVVYKLA